MEGYTFKYIWVAQIGLYCLNNNKEEKGHRLRRTGGVDQEGVGGDKYDQRILCEIPLNYNKNEK